MKRILFLIHDLGVGGAEKVLVNLVNHLDREKFDVSVTALFGGGVNEQFLAPDIHYRAVFPRSIPGNSRLMKLLTPRQLHRLCVREHYDIEVSYLEGPSARVISGCPHADTKLVSWIHVELHTEQKVSRAFRSYAEARRCYRRFDRTVCVSEYVRDDFTRLIDLEKPCAVLYNTVESAKILAAAGEPVADGFEPGLIHLTAVGKVCLQKGVDRLLRITRRLLGDGYPVRLHLLGVGPYEEEARSFLKENGMEQAVIFHGYQTNPYKYVAKADLFLCASHAEGFSTAATEALIVGTPVCTVEVSGMKEMLGQHNEWGVVTENGEESLYRGIRGLLNDPALLAHYREQAALRGRSFSTEQTVRAVEEMLLKL